jgi:hypothetical protein
MSAEIIQFVPRARCKKEPGRASAISYFPPRRCELTMDHADTAPCEYAPIYQHEHDQDTTA